MLVVCSRTLGQTMKYVVLDHWIKGPGQVIRIGGVQVTPAACMPFLGCVISREWLGAVRRRAAATRPMFLSIEESLLTRALSRKVCFSRFRTDISIAFLRMPGVAHAGWHHSRWRAIGRSLVNRG